MVRMQRPQTAADRALLDELERPSTAGGPVLRTTPDLLADADLAVPPEDHPLPPMQSLDSATSVPLPATSVPLGSAMPGEFQAPLRLPVGYKPRAKPSDLTPPGATLQRPPMRRMSSARGSGRMKPLMFGEVSHLWPQLPPAMRVAAHKT